MQAGRPSGPTNRFRYYVPVVGVDGHITGHVLEDLTGGMGEGIPNGGGLAILIPGTLHLIGRRGC